jgi:hypothetical protein
MPVICLMREADYFLREEWTGQITLETLEKLISLRILRLRMTIPFFSSTRLRKSVGQETCCFLVILEKGTAALHVECTKSILREMKTLIGS